MGVRTRVNWRQSGWTEKLDGWWNKDELTADQIARKLGISRGSVLAKIVRMGWCKSKYDAFTAAQIEQIERWWNVDGRTTKWIALKLGVTKNKVVGKINRMGWNGLRGGGSGGKNGFGYTSQEQRYSRVTSPGPLTTGNCATKIRVLESDPSVEARVSFVELKHNQCRWPFENPDGKDTYCGRDRDDSSSYCCDHHARSLLVQS